MNYENDIVPKLSYFYDEDIVPELFTKKHLNWKDLKKVTGRYCDTCGTVRNHKKAVGWPEINSVKKFAGENFQLTWLFTEDRWIQSYSTTIGYGVTKISQEGKTFQINIFFSVEHNIQDYSTTIWYGGTKI